MFHICQLKINQFERKWVLIVLCLALIDFKMPLAIHGFTVFALEIYSFGACFSKITVIASIVLAGSSCRLEHLLWIALQSVALISLLYYPDYFTHNRWRLSVRLRKSQIHIRGIMKEYCWRSFKIQIQRVDCLSGTEEKICKERPQDSEFDNLTVVVEQRKGSEIMLP